jgi:dipeptidyl aminopeptidase/acylaminoacyl peptidase
VRINLKDRTETVLFDPQVAAAGWRGHAVVRTFDGQDIAGFITGDGKPGIEWLDAKSPEARLTEAMRKHQPDHFLVPVSASRDGQRVLFLAAADRNDGDFYLYNRKTNAANFVMSRRAHVPIEALAETQPFSLKARDGVALHGYITLPFPKVENPPLVVMPHGGPHGLRDQWGYDMHVQALATRGYAVMQVNFRGSGGYGIDFQVSGYKQWGRKMQDDVTDATQHVLQAYGLDAKRVAIFGGSYGGYAALMGAVREPDMYRCAISYVGVAHLPLMYTRGDIEDSQFGIDYLKLVLGENEQELLANSPTQFADRIKAKVLLVHGLRDNRVPIKHAEMMRSALEKAGNKPEWYVEREEGHGFVLEANNQTLLERIDGFLNGCMGKG